MPTPTKRMYEKYLLNGELARAKCEMYLEVNRLNKAIAEKVEVLDGEVAKLKKQLANERAGRVRKIYGAFKLK